MIRVIGILVLVGALAACTARPQLSADIDVSEKTVTPAATFSLGGIGVRVRP